MTFESFFLTATGRQPYGFQALFATSEFLPDLLEAPTGAGKTATAVLGWLYRRLHGSVAQVAEAGNRLVFCLPMRTLVEQTEHNVLKWRSALGLTELDVEVHVLLGGRVAKEWHDNPDKPGIIIGTQDQLLSRALLRGYGMSRYMWPIDFAFLNNNCTWVMDEVQLMGVGASTAAQLQAFREQMKVAGSCKTLWMTATLAVEKLKTVDFQRTLTSQKFVANEESLIRRMNAKKTLSQATSTVDNKSFTAIAAEISNAHQADTLTLVVVNRVVRAQEIFAVLKKLCVVDGTEVRLIHSRFRPAERRKVQEAALSGEFRGILIATQAIEAGVDISAKTLFTELAPWPSVVQRLGRLNRAGEYVESHAYWIDLDTTDRNLCLPYEADLLNSARAKLTDLADVGPSSLARVTMEAEQPALPVLRRKDLLELFDTEPDLAGHDIDVARFVRATDERDVQVAWRKLNKAQPIDGCVSLHRDELCSVPFYELETLLKKNTGVAWRFDALKRTWAKTERFMPGMTLLVDVSVGGYDAERGFSRDSKDIPTDVSERDGPASDSDESDELTYWASEFVSLLVHSQDTAEEMEKLVAELRVTLAAIDDHEILPLVARWHDLGKGHAAFQEMLTRHLAEADPRRGDGPWAKSDTNNRMQQRRYFRHELASALAWMAEGHRDLGTYLIAAHHGKVRLSLRARPGEELPPFLKNVRFAHGVRDGDALPAADLGAGVTTKAHTLTLACMDLGGGAAGPSWADRMLRLLELYGPFRLSYLEALVRIADWRASRKRAPSATKGTSPV